MFTANQCRAKGLEKLLLAKAQPRHRRHYIKSAGAWFLLANRLDVGDILLRRARAEAEDEAVGYADTPTTHSR